MNNQDKIHVPSRAVIIDQYEIFLCKTLNLTFSFYFLPGGHVEHGESVEKSLLRELMDETRTQFKIKRFLGCLEYSFEPAHSSICHNDEYNFIIEVESEFLKSNHKIPQIEAHIELLSMPLNKFVEIDFRAEPLHDLIPKWLESDTNNSFKSVME